MYLLIHTMTVTQTDCVMVAQFFHTFNADTANVNLNSLQLIAKRVRVKMHPRTLVNRNKLSLQRSLSFAPNLKTIAKRKHSHVKHHIRTIKIVSPNRSNEYVQKIDDGSNNNAGSTPNLTVLPRCASDPNLLASEEQSSEIQKQITPDFTLQQTSNWLASNRFNNYLQTFTGFSGSDMLRMSKEDLVQICGQADGIRLFNALHSKSIAPKLTMYVCRENTNVFHAIYLTTHSSAELCQKLANLIGVPNEQIRKVYFQGPHGIHVNINDDVICHVKEESMFSVDIISDNNGYIIILKPIVK